MERAMFSTQLITFSIVCAFLPLVTSVTVSTKYGDVEGFEATYTPNVQTSFKSVSKFLGVPFAAPPMGELRLKPPQPPQKWNPKIHSAKKNGNSCLQPKRYENFFKRYTASNYNFTYSEDCLYLDIYTPNVSSSFPVLVYIHGGAFSGGTATTFNSDILALYGVVVVVIQYRLGPLGFLTTGDSAAPGNLGMLDQIEALKWIKENIEHFGGDHSKVTISGESAGGMSVGLLLLSPLSKGLFHQAIAESGIDLRPSATQPVSYGLRFAKELAQKLDCNTNDHSAMVDCIREKEGADIQKAADTISFRFYNYYRWAPVVDKKFLPDTPWKLRKNGNFQKVKFMISYNSNEGAAAFRNMVNSSFSLGVSVEDGVSPSMFKKFITALARARNDGKEVAELIADALEFMYTPWPDKSDRYALRSQLVDLVGDCYYTAPIHEVADFHSQHAPVYMYEFAHRSEKASIYPEWMGVAHFENVLYDFGVPLFPGLSSSYDDTDRNVSLFIMEVYANFAKFGDPTPQPVRGVTWESYNTSRRAYLRVDANPKMAESFAGRRMAFWNDYHPKLTQVKFETKYQVVNSASAAVAMAILLHITFIVIFKMFSV